MEIHKGKYRLENRNLNFDIVDDLNFNTSGDCFYFRGGNGFGKTSFLEKIIIPAAFPFDFWIICTVSFRC